MYYILVALKGLMAFEATKEFTVSQGEEFVLSLGIQEVSLRL